MAFSIGPEQLVNTTQFGHQAFPAVASLAGGGYAIAWEVNNLNGFGISTQLLDAAGDTIGPQIITRSSPPFVEWNASPPGVLGLASGNFVVGYGFSIGFGSNISTMNDVAYDASGQIIGTFTSYPIGPLGDLYSRTAVIPDGASFINVWADQPPPFPTSSPTIHSRILAQDLAIGGAQFTIADSPAATGVMLASPDAAQLANGNWVAVWDYGGLAVHANVFTPADLSVSGEFPVNITTQSGAATPRVAGLTDGDFVVEWSTIQNGSADIHARLFDPNGAPLGAEFLINANTAGDQTSPDVAALPDGGFVSVWQSNASGNWDIIERTFSANGVPTSDEQVVNTTLTGNETAPSVAVSSNGDALVSWIDNGQPVAGTSGTAVMAALLSSHSLLNYGDLIQSQATGQLTFLHLENGTLKASYLTSESYWPVVAEGDFDRNGTSDLVTQQNGQIDFVYMNGRLVTGSLLENGTYWDAKGAGAFSALPGAEPSIVTQNASGQIDLIQFNGPNLGGSLLIPGNYWDVVGVGDFNKDGNSAIVTQSSDGHIDLLFLNAQGTLSGSLEFQGTYWPVKAVGDYNHDGHPDLVTQDPVSGQIDHLSFTGTTLTGSLLENTPTPGWDVVHASHTAEQFWGALL